MHTRDYVLTGLGGHGCSRKTGGVGTGWWLVQQTILESGQLNDGHLCKLFVVTKCL